MTHPYIQGDYAAIILAAGKSARMGAPKFSLRYENESTFLEKIAESYLSFGCNEIIVVLNEESAALLEEMDIRLHQKVKISLNRHPEWERFFSLKTGLKSINKIRPAFVSNIDNPFINHEVLKKLASQIKEYDYVFPTFNGKGGHPFMISETIVNDIISMPEEQKHMKCFLNSYPRHGVEVDDEKVLLNINTIDDYRRIFLV